MRLHAKRPVSYLVRTAKEDVKVHVKNLVRIARANVKPVVRRTAKAAVRVHVKAIVKNGVNLAVKNLVKVCVNLDVKSLVRMYVNIKTNIQINKTLKNT